MAKMAKKKKKEKTKKLWANIKEKVENGAIEIFKDIMAKNFPKLMKYNKPQIQEAHKYKSKPKQSQIYRDIICHFVCALLILQFS